VTQLGRRAKKHDAMPQGLPGCFRLEWLPSGTYTHWKGAAFPRRTPNSVAGREKTVRRSNGTGSVQLRAGEFHDLRPFLGFLGDELAEVGG
jgi:hypothetical protein